MVDMRRQLRQAGRGDLVDLCVFCITVYLYLLFGVVIFVAYVYDVPTVIYYFILVCDIAYFTSLKVLINCVCDCINKKSIATC